MPKRDIIDVDQETFEEHPLFPLEEGEDPPDIAFIHITRWEKGKQVYASKLFTASELATFEQVQQIYGGGEYILIGRARSKTMPGQPGRVSRHRKVSISGAPKPMSDDPSDEELKKPGAPAPIAPSAGILGGGGGDSLFIAMMQMNQQAAERAAQAQQQFMTMFIQMMQSSKTESAAMTQMMMQMSQAQAQSMMQMVSGMMASRGGGPEEMSKYAELLKTLGFANANAPKAEEKAGFGLEDLPAMIENVADIATAAAELRRGAGGPTNGVTPPQIAPGDNSAAGIAAAMGLGKS